MKFIVLFAILVLNFAFGPTAHAKGCTTPGTQSINMPEPRGLR